MIRTVDMPAVVAPRGRNGHAGRRPPAVQGPPPDVASRTGPDIRPHHDQVTAVHDAIDFARALVADGGTQTSGLTMLRGEIGHMAREFRQLREEVAILRADFDRVRADVLRVQQFARCTLVDRLAAKFAEIDARLARSETGAAGQGDPSGRDLAQMRAGFGPPAGPPDPGAGGDRPPAGPPGTFGR